MDCYHTLGVFSSQMTVFNVPYYSLLQSFQAFRNLVPSSKSNDFPKPFPGSSVSRASRGKPLIGALQVRVPHGEESQSQMHAISNPLSPGNGDLRVVLSGHFCASLHVGHARSIRPVFDYRITGVEAQIKTNKQTISV